MERDKRQLGAGTDSIICICTHARQGTGRNSSRSSRKGTAEQEEKEEQKHDDDADEAVRKTVGRGGKVDSRNCATGWQPTKKEVSKEPHARICHATSR